MNVSVSNLSETRRSRAGHDGAWLAENRTPITTTITTEYYCWQREDFDRFLLYSKATLIYGLCLFDSIESGIIIFGYVLCSAVTVAARAGDKNRQPWEP